MQSLLCSAQGHSKCEVSGFQTIEFSEKKRKLNIKLLPFWIPKHNAKHSHFNIGSYCVTLDLLLSVQSHQ